VRVALLSCAFVTVAAGLAAVAAGGGAGGPKQPKAVSHPGYVGTATPTPAPGFYGLLALGPSDGEANRLARAIPTPTPSPTPSPTPTPARTPEPLAPVRESQPANSGQAQVSGDWVSEVCSYAWDCQTALRIIECESHGDIYAVNPSSGACGLWQHLPCAGYGSASASTALAWEKYSARGWQPWSCW